MLHDREAQETDGNCLFHAEVGSSQACHKMKHRRLVVGRVLNRTVYFRSKFSFLYPVVEKSSTRIKCIRDDRYIIDNEYPRGS